MGACNIEFTIKGKAAEHEIDEAFTRRRKLDAEYNGHQEGYSGDFQTVDYIEFDGTIFDNYGEAQEYCLAKAKKWEYAVAVYIEDPKTSEYTTLVCGWGAC